MSELLKADKQCLIQQLYILVVKGQLQCVSPAPYCQLSNGCCAQGGVVVKVGDFVELSPVPGEDLNRLVQVAALWSEPTQARQRMLASCHRFYRASVRPMLLLMHFEPQLWALTISAS